MTIDSDRLTEAELVDPNHRIGDRVTFEPPRRPTQSGTVTRSNNITMSVGTATGQAE